MNTKANRIYRLAAKAESLYIKSLVRASGSPQGSRAYIQMRYGVTHNPAPVLRAHARVNALLEAWREASV